MDDPLTNAPKSDDDESAAPPSICDCSTFGYANGFFHPRRGWDRLPEVEIHPSMYPNKDRIRLSHSAKRSRGTTMKPSPHGRGAAGYCATYPHGTAKATDCFVMDIAPPPSMSSSEDSNERKQYGLEALMCMADGVSQNDQSLTASRIAVMTCVKELRKQISHCIQQEDTLTTTKVCLCMEKAVAQAHTAIVQSLHTKSPHEEPLGNCGLVMVVVCRLARPLHVVSTPEEAERERSRRRENRKAPSKTNEKSKSKARRSRRKSAKLPRGVVSKEILPPLASSSMDSGSVIAEIRSGKSSDGAFAQLMQIHKEEQARAQSPRQLEGDDNGGGDGGGDRDDGDVDVHNDDGTGDDDVVADDGGNELGDGDGVDDFKCENAPLDVDSLEKRNVRSDELEAGKSKVGSNDDSESEEHAAEPIEHMDKVDEDDRMMVLKDGTEEDCTSRSISLDDEAMGTEAHEQEGTDQDETEERHTAAVDGGDGGGSGDDDDAATHHSIGRYRKESLDTLKAIEMLRWRPQSEKDAMDSCEEGSPQLRGGKSGGKDATNDHHDNDGGYQDADGGDGTSSIHHGEKKKARHHHGEGSGRKMRSKKKNQHKETEECETEQTMASLLDRLEREYVDENWDETYDTLVISCSTTECLNAIRWNASKGSVQSLLRYERVHEHSRIGWNWSSRRHSWPIEAMEYLKDDYSSVPGHIKDKMESMRKAKAMGSFHLAFGVHPLKSGDSLVVLSDGIFHQFYPKPHGHARRTHDPSDNTKEAVRAMGKFLRRNRRRSSASSDLGAASDGAKIHSNPLHVVKELLAYTLNATKDVKAKQEETSRLLHQLHLLSQRTGVSILHGESISDGSQGKVPLWAQKEAEELMNKLSKLKRQNALVGKRGRLDDCSVLAYTV